MKQAVVRGLRRGIREAEGFLLLDPNTSFRRTSGHHLANRQGRSLEYHDFRDYQPGDDLRDIDWHAYARSDRLIVKRFQAEVMPHLDLLVDGSASMGLEESAKAEATAALAAFWAQVAERAGFSHRLWLVGEHLKPMAAPRTHPASWQGLTFEAARSPGETLINQANPFKSRGMRILISDLLWPADPSTLLQRLGRGASSVLVQQILAQSDRDPPINGRWRLTDSETGETRDVHIDERGRRRYLTRLQRHLSLWQEASRIQGVVMATLVAEDLLDRWWLDPQYYQRFLRTQ